MHSHTSLYNELTRNLQAINRQIDQLHFDAREAGVTANELRLQDGSYPMNTLLLAKAKNLDAMAVLMAAKAAKK